CIFQLSYFLVVQLCFHRVGGLPTGCGVSGSKVIASFGKRFSLILLTWSFHPCLLCLIHLVMFVIPHVLIISSLVFLSYSVYPVIDPNIFTFRLY
ncbi:hypothetical protein C0J52_03614, partial [Blattella germanica]